MSDYVISVGGTGCRCAESVAHLAATDVFPRPLHHLLVDMDQRNGNLQRTFQALARYEKLSELVDSSSMFAKGVEHHVWQSDGLMENGSKKFGALLGRDAASPNIAHFLDTFFPASYYDIDLSGGCFQKPEIGAIALRLMLRQSLADKNNALRITLTSIADDLRAGKKVRIFVIGSVFGGTGASGLPFLPRLLRDEIPELLPEIEIQADQLSIGAAIITPYFQWMGSGGSDPNAPDPNRLSPHAKAVLLHYGKHPPGYQDIYVVGAPELFPSGKYAASGQRQLHVAHYIEMTAALAALDFFRQTDRTEQSFHYAESTRGGETQERRQLGINWETMPFGATTSWEVRQGLLRLAITARFAMDYLLPRLRGESFGRYPWFEDGVGAPLPAEEEQLISDTFDNQLRWLREILESISAIKDGQDHPSLFPLRQDELTIFEAPLADIHDADPEVVDRIRRLVRGDREGSDFHELCSRLDNGTVDPSALAATNADRTVLGRLLYFAEGAVASHLEYEEETIALLEPATPADERETQSRFLPRIQWEPGVEAQIGAFTRGGPELLQSLAEGLDIGEAEAGASNPISSPWARAFLFETALARTDRQRQRAVTTWRGLLGILAFRLSLGGLEVVRDASIRLDQNDGRAVDANSLHEFAREAKSFDYGNWLDFRLLLIDGLPIAGSSPLTLLFPSAGLSKVLSRARRVPWFDPETGHLGDPAPYLGRHGATHRYLSFLKAWIEQVLRRPPRALKDALAGSEALELVQRELRDWSESRPLAAVSPARLQFEQPPIMGHFLLPAIPAQQRI